MHSNVHHDAQVEFLLHKFFFNHFIYAAIIWMFENGKIKTVIANQKIVLIKPKRGGLLHPYRYEQELV